MAGIIATDLNGNVCNPYITLDEQLRSLLHAKFIYK